MLRKLVLPEYVIIPRVAHPILVHPSQQVVLSKVLQRWGRDISSGKRFDRLTGVPTLSVVGSGDGVESNPECQTMRGQTSVYT
jgi:hypothetical protein